MNNKDYDVSAKVVSLSEWDGEGFNFEDYLKNADGNSRVKQRVLNPMQLLVDDTNEVIRKYHGEPFDNFTKSNMRNDLRSLAISWIAEKLMKDDFDIEKYVEDMMQRVERANK